MTASPILESLLADRILVLDGAMGTQLQRLGLVEADFRGEQFRNHSSHLLGNYDLLSLTRPDLVSRVHGDYLDAGADIILTNSFGGTRQRLKLHNAEGRVHELNKRAAEIARSVADKAGRNACPNHTLEHLTENAMVAEALVARTREHGVIRDLVLNAKTAKPAIGKIDPNFAA